MRNAIDTSLPALLLGSVALTLGACSVSVDLDGDATRRIENDTMPLSGLTSVEVTTENGAVEVVGGAVDEIELRVELEEEDEGDADYSLDTEGDVAVVTGTCDAGAFEDCSVAFRIAVPGDFDVSVRSDNGRIAIDGVTGDVDVQTDNGAIEGERLEAESVLARSDNGRIDLSFDAPPLDVDAETDNGAISIRLPDDGEAYDVDAASDNGRVDVDVPIDPTAARTLVARSDNGSIAIR